MLDTSTDSNGHKHLIIGLRTTVAYAPRTFFWKKHMLRGETGTSLLSYLIRLFEEDSSRMKHIMQSSTDFEGRFWNQVVSLSTDGASVVSGQYEGLRGLLGLHMLQQTGRSNYFVHCSSHNLDLAVKDITKKGNIYTSFVRTLYSTVYKLFGSAVQSKNIEMLHSTCELLGIKSYNLKTLYEVRWAASEEAALTNLLRMYRPIVNTLDLLSVNPEIKKDGNKKLKLTIDALRYVMSDARTFLLVHLYKEILGRFALVSKSFQSSTSIIPDVHRNVRALITDLGLYDHSTESWLVAAEMRLDIKYGLQCLTETTWKKCSTSDLKNLGISNFGIKTVALKTDVRKEGLAKPTSKLQGLYAGLDILQDSQTAKDIRSETERFRTLDSSEEEKSFANLIRGRGVHIPTAVRGDSQETVLLKKARQYAAEWFASTKDDEEDFASFSIADYALLPKVAQNYLAIEWTTYGALRKTLTSFFTETLKARFSSTGDASSYDSYHWVAFEKDLILDAILLGNPYNAENYDDNAIKKRRYSWYYNHASRSLNLREREVKTNASIDFVINLWKLPLDTKNQYVEFILNLKYLTLKDTSFKSDNIDAFNTQELWTKILKLTKDDISYEVKDMIQRMIAIPTGTSDIETMFSLFFLNRNKRRSRLTDTVTDAIMTIKFNGPPLHLFNPTPFSLFWKKNDLKPGSTAERFYSDDPRRSSTSKMLTFKELYVNQQTCKAPYSTRDLNLDIDEDEDLHEIAEDCDGDLRNVQKAVASSLSEEEDEQTTLESEQNNIIF